MPEQADYELMALIKRLATLLYQNIDQALKPYDLARTQYGVLHNLRESGSLPTGELVAKLQIEPATVSGLIDTLEAKGLVARIEHPADKRRKDVRLTAEGQRLIDGIPPLGPSLEEVLRQDIDDNDVYILRAVGRQMVANLEKQLRKQEGVAPSVR